jgi:hypothetical protein
MKITSVAALAALLAAAPALAQSDSSPKNEGNDFLCTQWGCVGGSLTGSVSTWRGNSEGDYQNNDGGSIALDAAAPIPFLAEYGFGVQGAVSQGIYDLDGRDSGNSTNPQRQQFVSFGVFRRPNPNGEWWDRWGAGAVYDAAYNHNFGIQNDTFVSRQVRGKASYDVYGGNEVGFWFADYHGTAYAASDELNSPTPDAYRAVDQLNFFYKYNLERGGSLSAYFGPGIGGQSIVPDNPSGTPSGGRVFTYTFGANATVPFCDYAAMTGGFSYGRPNSTLSPIMANSSLYDAFSVSMGLRLYWGGNARVREDTGRHWMPYLADPDNSNFLVQSNFVN